MKMRRSQFLVALFVSFSVKFELFSTEDEKNISPQPPTSLSIPTPPLSLSLPCLLVSSLAETNHFRCTTESRKGATSHQLMAYTSCPCPACASYEFYLRK